jgi:hypothetical protein
MNEKLYKALVELLKNRVHAMRYSNMLKWHLDGTPESNITLEDYSYAMLEALQVINLYEEKNGLPITTPDKF